MRIDVVDKESLPALERQVLVRQFLQLDDPVLILAGGPGIIVDLFCIPGSVPSGTPYRPADGRSAPIAPAPSPPGSPCLPGRVKGTVSRLVLEDHLLVLVQVCQVFLYLLLRLPQASLLQPQFPLVAKSD